MAEREHGTHARYVIDRCRCDLCRQAQRDYNRNRVRQMSRPDGVWEPYVDAEPVRDHIAWLRTCGIGLKSLAGLAGVPHGTLSKLVYGDHARHMVPSKRVRPTTAGRIMAVMPHHAGGAQRVPAAPTWRLLDDLIGRGWSRAELARRLGHQGPGLQIRRDRVLASTARQVERLHAELVQVLVIPRKTRWGVVSIPVPAGPAPRRIPRATAGHRLPLEPLARVAGMSESALCLHFGINSTRFSDGLDESQADELAVRLGLHPALIWGEAWADA